MYIQYIHIFRSEKPNWPLGHWQRCKPCAERSKPKGDQWGHWEGAISITTGKGDQVVLRPELPTVTEGHGEEETERSVEDEKGSGGAGAGAEAVDAIEKRCRLIYDAFFKTPFCADWQIRWKLTAKQCQPIHTHTSEENAAKRKWRREVEFGKLPRAGKRSRWEEEGKPGEKTERATAAAAGEWKCIKGCQVNCASVLIFMSMF